MKNFRFKFSSKSKQASKRIVLKSICLFLMFSLLTTTTVAAPSVIVGKVAGISQDIRFAFLSGRLAIGLPNWFAALFAANQNVSSTVNPDSIEIFPGSVSVRQGEEIVFSAIGYDADGEPLSGIPFSWQVADTGRGLAARPLNNGRFQARLHGTFTVTAQGGGRQKQVIITVTPGLNQTNLSQVTPINISTRSEAIKREKKESPQNVQNLNSEGGWNDNNWNSSDDPGNLPGNPPGHPADDGAGNGNFQLSAPVISLPGRGIDLALNLNYNSRLWNKSGNQVTFDIDRGFPAPGWSLGFGKIVDMGANGGSMLVDADGTRHGYAGTLYPGSGGSAGFAGHTADGKFIDYQSYRNSNGIQAAAAHFPNGTVIGYGASNGYAVYPTYIRDAQGNYITITYRSNQGPAIQTVTDTLGRAITFQYDSDNRLISAKAPRMQNEDPIYAGGKTRTLFRLHYKPLTLNYSFASNITPTVRDNPIQIIDAILYPATGTGYWLSDTDSYSTYGMLTKVIEQRGMSWSSSAEAQGIINPGQMTKQANYNYPLTAANETGRTNGVNLTDAPTYTSLKESWALRDVNEDAVTTYNFDNNTYKWDGTSNSPARLVTITQPNGAISKQYSYRTPNAWMDGLVFADETIVDKNATPTVVSSSLVSWQQGEYDSPRPTWAEITDENGSKAKTVYSYTSGKFNQVTRSCDYDNGNNLLQCATAEYENSSIYIGYFSGTGVFQQGRHIFSLLKTSGIENADGTKASWAVYEYDNYQNNALINTSGVIQHEATHNPYTTETVRVEDYCIRWEQEPLGDPYCVEWEYIEVSVYDAATDKRGNITKITNYADAQNLSGAIYENRSYDITGNLRTASTACCEQTSIEYLSGTQYAYPASQTRGAADANSIHRITTSATYDKDTGLVKTTTDANGRTSLTMYHPDTLRPVKAISSTGAYTVFSYDDTAMTITEEVREANNNLAGETIKRLNGIGKVWREEALGINQTYDFIETKYSKLGEVWKQSRPFRGSESPVWSETIYDEQGRTKEVIEPDGSTSKAFYNETPRPDSATNAVGNTIRVVDAWGRERWARYDQRGKLAEVVEPNPNGNGSVMATGSLLAKYTHDTLGRLTKTEQGSQIREFKYDSLGRLTRQKLAEQTATLNDAGQFVGANGTGAMWSEAFSFDTRSNLTQKTDARGVRTIFSYQISGADDPLNRLQTVSYDQSGPTEANLTIHAAANVSYSYLTSGDKTRLSQIRTDGLLTENFTYDAESRIINYKQTIDYRTGYPMEVSYLYDTLDRVTDIQYPAAYGLGGISPRKLIQPTYDTASRLSSLKVDNTEVAGTISYNAADQTESIKIGAAVANQVTETYTYDNLTGLLTNQKVQTSTQTLLDLSYDYQRNNSVGNANGKTGHLTKIINNLDSNKDREYEFDGLGRLTKAKGGNARWQQTYAYDRYGNRTNVTATGTAADNSAIPVDGIPNLTYNTTNNRITTAGFEYDSAGNQTRALAEDGTWLKYEYDAANRLKVVKKDDGTLLQSFQYGSTNARLMDLDYQYGYLKIFGNNGAIEYTEFAGATPTWTKSYVYLGERLLSTVTPNGSGGETTEYNHPDRLGTRTVTNQTAGTSYEQTTLPFGTALNGESSGANSKRFTSYERSVRTGLDYAINRTYDSKLGRFTQIDPIGMKAVNPELPQTLNLYNYCGNDPINHTDPDGLFWGALKRFFKAVLKVLLFVALIVAMVVLINTGVGLIGAGGFFNTLFGILALGGASFLGAKIGATVASQIKEWVNSCRAPDFNGLSGKRQKELSERGVSPEQWNNLKNKQRLGYFNIIAAITSAGLSLLGWVVDWAAGGIQQDRTFFKQIAGAVNLLSIVSMSPLFTPDISGGILHGKYKISFRSRRFLRSTQISFLPNGTRMVVDIDYFNPNRGLGGYLGHAYEVVSHALGFLFGGTKSNPYNSPYRSSWECK